jgi:broad specificity phosphatase PhoE
VLILVRHGQTTMNATGRLQGRLDAPLTELGRRQAAAIATVVTQPSVVVTSPLLRARETADAFGVGARVDERWIELDYGDLDGKPISEVPADLWDRWRAHPEFAPPRGESMSELGHRVRAACEELAPVAATEDVVVVSHVSPIKAAVAWALGVGDETTWRMFLDVASICRVAVSARGASLVTFNERAHVGGLMSGA